MKNRERVRCLVAVFLICLVAGAALLKDRAVERTIDVRELRGASAAGCYFSATDRAPKPGEFKIATQGFVMIGDLLVGFTILTNDGQRHVVESALEMVRGARYVPSSSSSLPTSRCSTIRSIPARFLRDNIG